MTTPNPAWWDDWLSNLTKALPVPVQPVEFLSSNPLQDIRDLSRRLQAAPWTPKEFKVHCAAEMKRIAQIFGKPEPTVPDFYTGQLWFSGIPIYEDSKTPPGYLCWLDRSGKPTLLQLGGVIHEDEEKTDGA